MSRKTRIILSGFAIVTAAAGVATLAGDLDPPPGPVAPTLKTLTEVEPRIAINATNTPGDADSLFKITQPGAYYLTGNINGVSAKHGIEIAASGVTVDLMGFGLIGVAGSLDGIRVSTSALNIAVRNGAAQGWGDDGIDLNSATNSMVEKLRVSSNVGAGLRIGSGGNVLDCTAMSNVLSGIITSTRCTVTQCTCTVNGGGALTGHGILTGSECVISGCAVSGNGAGAGGGNGILTGTGCKVTGCLVSSNGNAGTVDNDGIRTASASAVIHCLVILNKGDGIQTAFQSLVLGNNCIANGSGGDGAGIHAANADNRIEGNNCTGADRGIDVDAAGNIIVRNTCSGNTLNWDVAANNKCLVVLGVNAGTISGDSGGVSPGSADPNANFTY
jgi:parallel beta-helix repeat protein